MRDTPTLTPLSINLGWNQKDKLLYQQLRRIRNKFYKKDHHSTLQKAWDNIFSQNHSQTHNDVETVAVLIEKNSNKVIPLDSIEWGAYKKKGEMDFNLHTPSAKHPSSQFLSCIDAWNRSVRKHVGYKGWVTQIDCLCIFILPCRQA